MTDFFFFTDIDLLVSQTSDEAFGSILPTDSDYDANKEKYRLTSIHKAASNPLAYAICKGQILVQEDSTNSTLVNIILKPEIQPKNDLPVIKYYIYRGILKNSLTDGTNVINGSNTLTKHVLDNNTSTPQKVLGIELTGTNYSGTDNIDNAFYLPKIGFELWTVYGGWSIGTFDKNGFGLDIVFERLGYNPDFNIARSNKNIFEIQKLTGTPSQADEFEHKTKKEVVLNYIDPCAFYGNFYSDAINARSSSDSIDSNSLPSFNKKKGDEIYREIIEGGTSSSPLNNYYNKNVVYLDIRNDLNFSFNYFENYDNNLKLSFIDDNNEPTTLFDYYSSGWPILKLDSLPTGNNISFVRIAFPINEMVEPLVCVLSGKRKIPFIEKIKKGKSKFMKLDADLSTNYSSNSVFLTSPNYNNSIPIGQYLKVKYINQLVSEFSLPPNDYTPVKTDSIDFVFQPTELTQPFTTNDSIKINVYDEDVYVNFLEDFDIDYTSKIGIAKDLNNTILFNVISKRNTKPRFKAQAASFSITKSTDNSTTFFSEFINAKANPDSLSSNNITIGTDSIQLIKEVQKKHSFFNNRNSINFNTEFSSIILSNTDFTTIQNIAQSNFTSIFQPYICVKNKTNGTDDAGSPYVSYELTLKGLNRNASNDVEIKEVSTGVNIYSFPTNELKN